MEDLELFAAIRKLRPDSEFSFTDADYSTIKWNILNGDAPTLAEIKTALTEIKADEIARAAKVETDKAALLAKLGITADEAKLLLS
jgi:hypothetical protein